MKSWMQVILLVLFLYKLSISYAVVVEAEHCERGALMKLLQAVFDCAALPPSTSPDSCTLTRLAFHQHRDCYVDDVDKNCKILFPQRLTSKVGEVDRETAFVTIFEDYVLKNRPFKSHCFGYGVSAKEETQINNRPNILRNNYLSRLSGFTDLPLRVEVEGSVKLACPAKTHMVLWLQQNSPSLRIDTHDYRPTRYWTEMKDIASATNYDTAELFQPRRILEDKPFCKTESNNRVVGTTLKQEEFLFLPSSFFAHLQSTTSSEVLAQCFVDASNLHFVLQELAILRPIMSENMHSELSRMSSIQFNRTMQREPGVEIVESSVNSAGKSRRRRRGGDYKRWQDTQAWDALVNAYSAAAVYDQVSVSVDRKKAVVRFQEPSQLWLTEQAKSSFQGFSVQVCSLDMGNVLTDELLLLETGSVQLISQTWWQSHCKEELIPRSAAQVVENSDSAFVNVGLEILDLNPDSHYQFRVRRYFDIMPVSSSSPSTIFVSPGSSSWSEIYLTLPLARPVLSGKSTVMVMNIRPLEVKLPPILQALYPTRRDLSTPSATLNLAVFYTVASTLEVHFPSDIDAGGLPLLRWEIFSQRLENSFSTEWSRLLSVPILEKEPEERRERDSLLINSSNKAVNLSLYNLQPGALYSFKIRCCNALGCSNFTFPSEQIGIPPISATLVRRRLELGFLVVLHPLHLYNLLLKGAQPINNKRILHVGEGLKGDDASFWGDIVETGSQRPFAGDAFKNVVIIDSWFERIFVWNPKVQSSFEALHIWRCSHSSPHHLIMAAPAFLHNVSSDLSEELLSSVKNKVAFLPRNGQALYELALLAQSTKDDVQNMTNGVFLEPLEPLERALHLKTSHHFDSLLNINRGEDNHDEL
eukprot:gene2586-2828_t